MPHPLVLNYLSSRQISSSIKHFTPFQRGIYRNDTFRLLLKTLLKESFTNKGEILSCKSVKPCKNRKNSLAYYVRTREKSGSNFPPFQRNVQPRPPPRARCTVKCSGYARGGGDVEVSKCINNPLTGHYDIMRSYTVNMVTFESE